MHRWRYSLLSSQQKSGAREVTLLRLARAQDTLAKEIHVTLVTVKISRIPYAENWGFFG